MKIMNVMFSVEMGGIQQVFLNYNQMLTTLGHQVLAVHSPYAAIMPQLVSSKVQVASVHNWGSWDPFAFIKLRKLLKAAQPDLILAHGNRAIQLLTRVSRGKFPVIGIMHNYKIQHIHKCQAAISVSAYIAELVKKQGVALSYTLPNSIEIPKDLSFKPRKLGDSLIIGTMGRFVPKKGMDVFLRSLKLLKDQNMAFKAKIGGHGPEEGNLKALTAELNLADQVEFLGWVKDQKAFFEGIDVFCLPSREEPFGVVLLEAFLHKCPVVATETIGPLEIIGSHQGKSRIAQLVKIGDETNLAQALMTVKTHYSSALEGAEAAFDHLVQHYAHQAVQQQFDALLKQLFKAFYRSK